MAYTLHSRFWKAGLDGIAVLTDPEEGSIIINTKKNGGLIESFGSTTKLADGHYTVGLDDDLYTDGEIYEIERIWNFLSEDTQSSLGRFSFVKQIIEITGLSVSSSTPSVIRATARVT